MVRPLPESCAKSPSTHPVCSCAPIFDAPWRIRIEVNRLSSGSSPISIDSTDGELHPEAQHIPKQVRLFARSSSCTTSERAEAPQIVLTHAKGMNAVRSLAISRSDLKPSEVVNLYDRRFTIEERFRDIKD